jgi:putative MFS transporter
VTVRAFSWRDIRASFRPDTLSVLLVSMLGVTLSTADQSLFSYAIPDITREFGIGLETIGQILSISFLVASAAVVIVGLAADQFGRRRVFVALLSLSAFIVGLHALAPTLASLATLRVLGFAVGAGLYPIANTLVVEAAPDRYRGFVSGLLQIGYPLGFAVASLIAAPVMAEYGWRAIFYAGFAIALFAPLVGRWLPESQRFEAAARQATAPRSSQRRIATLFSPGLRRRSLVCFAGSFLISLAIGGTTYFLPTYLVQAHALAPAEASRLAGSAYLIGAIGYVSASYVGEFVTTRRNTLILWILAGAVVFAATLWLAESQLALMLGLGLSIVFFYGSEAVRMPLIGELFPTEVRATATAMTGSLAVTTAWLASPLLISYLAPVYGWAATFTVCAVVPLVLGGLMFLALENLRSGLPVEVSAAAAR